MDKYNIMLKGDLFMTCNAKIKYDIKKLENIHHKNMLNAIYNL